VAGRARARSLGMTGLSLPLRSLARELIRLDIPAVENQRPPNSHPIVRQTCRPAGARHWLVVTGDRIWRGLLELIWTEMTAVVAANFPPGEACR